MKPNEIFILQAYQAAVHAALARDQIKLDTVISEHVIVWRRRGLLRSKRLDKVLNEAERMRAILLNASHTEKDHVFSLASRAVGSIF
jgi:hypothetical protein